MYERERERERDGGVNIVSNRLSGILCGALYRKSVVMKISVGCIVLDLKYSLDIDYTGKTTQRI